RGRSDRVGGLVVRQAPLAASPASRLSAVSRLCRGSAAAKRKATLPRLSGGCSVAFALPWGVAGCSSRRPTRFFAPPKKWGKKGGPYDGGPRFARTARAART